MFWKVGCLLGASGVALGAFGSHGLKKIIADPQKIQSWQTAAHYQILHSGVILASTLLPKPSPVASSLLCTGVFLFSGSIYALILSQRPSDIKLNSTPCNLARFLGPLTPIGGLCLIGVSNYLRRHSAEFFFPLNKFQKSSLLPTFGPPRNMRVTILLNEVDTYGEELIVASSPNYQPLILQRVLTTLQILKNIIKENSPPRFLYNPCISEVALSTFIVIAFINLQLLERIQELIVLCIVFAIYWICTFAIFFECRRRIHRKLDSFLKRQNSIESSARSANIVWKFLNPPKHRSSLYRYFEYWGFEVTFSLDIGFLLPNYEEAN